MKAVTLAGFFSQTNVLVLFLTFLICIINIFIGASILPKDKRQKRYRIHKALFWGVIFFYIIFLFLNHDLNSWFEYFILVYFLGIVRWSKQINVTLHAVIASVGMVLLGSIFAFRLL